jgi:hypothetical protein
MDYIYTNMVGLQGIMDVTFADKNSQLRETIDRAMSQINTCLPGVIESFDATTQTVTVKPGIQIRTNIDGKIGYLDLPQIINVPILFPYAAVAGFALTLPIRSGDPCLLVFSQRAIDNWHDQGGVQPPENNGLSCRHHDLTDAFALLAPNPVPLALSNWEAEGIELRNRARTTRITVRDDEIEFRVGDTVMTLGAGGLIINTLATFQDGVYVSGGELYGPPVVDLIHHKHGDTSEPTN